MDKDKLWPHFYGAYQKGFDAGEIIGAKEEDCPYRDYRGDGRGMVTWSRSFRKYWFEGFEDAKTGKPFRYERRNKGKYRKMKSIEILEMSKKQIQAGLLDLINDAIAIDDSAHPFLDWIVDRVEIIDRPNVVVELNIFPPVSGASPYHAYGWAKVCWPDEWNEADGISLATEKAVSRIAKQIYNEKAAIT